MVITLYFDSFLQVLFPMEKSDVVQLKNNLKEYYTLGPFEPIIEISENEIQITINTDKYLEDKKEYHKLISLCEKGVYSEAIPLAKQLIKKSPNVSEYHRILGQILSEQGDQEEAINCLIDALRWNPANKFALLMMGNIFAKFKKDHNTANIYYSQILENNPTDHITLVNIGMLVFQQGQLVEALKYLNKAKEIQPNYPNTYMAFVKIAEEKKDWQDAINNAIETLKCCVKKDIIYQNALHSLIESCNNYMHEIDAFSIINSYKGKLEAAGDKNINISENSDIKTPAKIEIAEHHNKPVHNVYFKPNFKAFEYLIMHELVHLDFVIEARKSNTNQLFTSTNLSKDLFLNTFEKSIKKKLPKSLDDTTIKKITIEIFHGLNLRAYNAPIDLFIEDYLFKNYPALRAFQCISLMQIIEDNINSVTNSDILNTFPSSIISKNRIYNIISALQFKELFGIDTIDKYKASKTELNTANRLYEEFKEYQDNRKPGEEYELVQHWAEDLDLNHYFVLKPENVSKNLKTVEEVITEMNTDPYGLNTPDKSKERQMKAFLNQQANNDINKAVVMYMVGAMQYFKPLSKEIVKKIAYEFATLGMTGIDPNKNNYSINSIKDKTFTGYQVLAYYYVSWSIAVPEQLKELQMPFDKEFEQAQKLVSL